MALLAVRALPGMPYIEALATHPLDPQRWEMVCVTAQRLADGVTARGTCKDKAYRTNLEGAIDCYLWACHEPDIEQPITEWML